MYVYVVTYRLTNESYVDAVFSTKEKAKEYIMKRINDLGWGESKDYEIGETGSSFSGFVYYTVYNKHGDIMVKYSIILRELDK